MVETRVAGCSACGFRHQGRCGLVVGWYRKTTVGASRRPKQYDESSLASVESSLSTRRHSLQEVLFDRWSLHFCTAGRSVSISYGVHQTGTREHDRRTSRQEAYRSSSSKERILAWLVRRRPSFLRTCQPCVQYHRGPPPRLAQLKPMLVGELFERVSIDITGPHPHSAKGHVFLLTVMDHFTKWAEAVPLRNRTASTVARALMVNE